MRARLDRAWRSVGTGICFAVFGIVGLVAGLTLFPLLCLSTRDPEVARRRAQRLTHRWFSLFCRLLVAFRLLDFEVRHAERLRVPGRLIVANHPSLIDVVLLLAHTPEVDCIVKPGVLANPFLRWPAKWSGYISQASPEQLIRDCAAALSQDHSLLVFPEGTRTVPGQPIHMGHGAARMAIEARCEVLPVAIHCVPPHLFKHQPFWRVPPRRPRYRLDVGAPYPATRFLDAADGVPSLAARRLTRHWEEDFTDRVGPRMNSPLAEGAGQPQTAP